MKNVCIFTVLPALCGIAIGRPWQGNNAITCKTSGVVLEGTTADITCDFHRGLNQVEGIFYVIRNSSEDALIMAICSWKEGHQACRVVGDFVLKDTTPDGKVTFEVPSAKQKHSGHYKCKTLPAEEASADACTLTVQKDEIIGDHLVACQTSSPVQLGEDASLLCMFPKTVGITGVILERYYPQSNNKEEIVRCDKDEDCQVHKAGYVVDQKTDSYLRISIPGTTQDKAGVYMCRSTYIKRESGACALELSSGEKETKEGSSLKKNIIPLYAVLACFTLLIVLGLVAYIQRSPCLSWCFLDEDKRQSVVTHAWLKIICFKKSWAC